MSPTGPDRSVLAIAATTVGVYVLVMAGATAAIVDAVATCSTWPTCGQAGFTLDDPQLLVAWAHRILAVLVGLLLVWAAASVWNVGGRWVRMGIIGTLVLYPVQIALGALVAIRGATSALTGIHLLLGMAMFAGLVAVLALRLRESFDGSIDDDSFDIGGPTPPAHDATIEDDPTSDDRPDAVGSSDTWGLPEIVMAYLRLTKPRLMWLLCLVAAAGMALAAGPALTVGTTVATLVGGVLAIGASGTFNHVLERDLDRRMQRTSDRPLATEQIGVRRAFAFGFALALAAVIVFASINLLAAALGLAAIGYYSVVYTLLLKPSTVQNTVIGGLAGSFPALIGAAAATETIGAPALLLGLVIFLWTPAHFYNLALVYREDYARGGVPMFPVVKGEATTRTHILGYLGATLLAVAALTAVAGLGPLYAVTAVVFGTVFLWTVVDLHRRPARTTAWRSFHASNAFLGAILLAVVVDALVV